MEGRGRTEPAGWLIKNLQPPVVNALVFSRTKHGADKIARDLTKQGIPAAAIHGNKSQTARVTALEDFKAGKTRVLVATDIAARGIDISELSHVFNYDLPEVPEKADGNDASTGRVKGKVGLCKGKKLYDKRASAAERDAKRQIERAMKER